MRHLASTYITLAIQSKNNNLRIADWLDSFFWWKDHLSFFSSCILFNLCKKKSTFKVGCLYSYLLVWQQICSHHHFEYMHLFQVNYEVKFHLLFLIFPLAPFLKDRFPYTKGRQGFLDEKGTWFPAADINSCHGVWGECSRGPRGLSFPGLMKLRELSI